MEALVNLTEIVEREVDHAEIQAESALARAQSVIHIALTAGSRRQHVVRRYLGGVKTSYLRRVRQGDYDLTVRELGKILAACGYRLTLGMELADPRPEGSETK